MKSIAFATVGHSPALIHARNQLAAWGYPIVPEIEPSVTHILLPVPSLDKKLQIHDGPPFKELLYQVPTDCKIMGGMIPKMPEKTIDFLDDEYYTAENASITAHCALTYTLQKMKRTTKDEEILIIGWGRIGKCLSELFRSIGSKITVAVRNEKDEAILLALGYHSIRIHQIRCIDFSIIINTVPAPILTIPSQSNHTLILDLASERGLSGDQVLWERGLPGRMAPESSGILIAKTALRYALRKE